MTKILVVEDDPKIRKALKRIFKRAKYEVLEAENGKLALEQIIEEPDLVLMDMMMPEMDGITAIKKIRELSKYDNIPIITLSAVSDKAKWVEALEAGANDYVPKPYDLSELKARVHNHLEAAGLKKEIQDKNKLLENEKELASKVQRTILPRNFNFPALEVEKFYQPSDQLSGDFFDIFKIGNSINFLIADVAGHGTASALIMAAAKGILRSQASISQNLIQIIQESNRLLCEMLGESELFLTLIFGIFQEEKNEIEIVSAGHSSVFLTSKDKIKPIESTGMPLGWFPDIEWEVIRFPFVSGESLFLCTDGIIEAQDENKQQFGQDRLINLLQGSNEPKQVIKKIFESVKGFCQGKFGDDVAMLSIKRK